MHNLVEEGLLNVLVTGGAGNIGHVTVAHLLEKNFSVRVLDNVPEKDIDGNIAECIGDADYRQVDIRNYEELRTYFDDINMAVHLAALPYPTHGKEAELFSINVEGTFNVFQAAASTGIKRVICASSINVLGNGFGRRRIDVQYFPVDEAHPGYTTDVYAFSKEIVEATAHYFWRREGISSICMRYPFVYNPMGFTGELFTEQHQRTQQAYEALMAMPEEERRKNMDTLLAKHWDLRQTRDNGEIDFREMFRNFQTILDVMPGAGLLFGRDDFWAALDVRDAAKSIELALLADFEGCHPLYVASTHNSTGVPSRDLAGLFYPEVQTWKRPIEGTESLLNIEKAQTLLGFEPDYSV